MPRQSQDLFNNLTPKGQALFTATVNALDRLTKFHDDLQDYIPSIRSERKLLKVCYAFLNTALSIARKPQRELFDELRKQNKERKALMTASLHAQPALLNEEELDAL